MSTQRWSVLVIALWCSSCASEHTAKSPSPHSKRDHSSPAEAAEDPVDQTGPQPGEPPPSPADDSPPSRSDPPQDAPTAKPAEPEPAKEKTSDAANTPPAAAVTEWRLIGYDEASTYFNSKETKLTKKNAAQLELAWQADMGGSVYGAPLQIGDRIYASGPKDVCAFEASTGKEVWRAAIQSTGSLAYANENLFINNAESGLVALHASDGRRLWSKKVDAQSVDAMSSPIVAGDRVYIGASNGGAEISGGGSFRGFVAALDRPTGANVWTSYTVANGSTGAGVFSSVSLDVTGNRLFATTANNYSRPTTDTSDAFLAFDLTTGALVWKNQRVEDDVFDGVNSRGWTDSDFVANPVLYEAMVDGQATKLVAAANKGSKGGVHALRRADGSLLWTRILGEGSADGARGMFASTTWSGKHLLVACNEGGPATLYALDGATGDVVWRRPLEKQVWGRISVANGVGFVGVGPQLEVFDVDTGERIKTFPSKGGTIAGTVTIANGRVAFGEGLTWSTGIAGRMLTVLALP